MMLCPATGNDCDVQGCVGGGLCKRRREQLANQPDIMRRPPPPDEIERRREAGAIDDVRLRVSRVLNNLNKYPLHSDKIDAVIKAVRGS